jgi:tetratricopeptide (TPR) repeat protein
MKKVLLLAGLAVLTALQAAVAWNARLCWQAKAVAATPEDKIRILLRADKAYPWNGAVHFELGRAYFERGTEALNDPAVRDRSLQLSVGSFLRSLRFDPASSETHFHLAQTLLYMTYVPLPAPLGAFDEYMKAAALTGHNSQIYFEVGRVLLGRWDALSTGEKGFVEDIIKKTLAGGDQDRLLDLLGTWSLGSRDAALLERVLPDDGPSLRACARFLGERSIALEARHSALARAEKLDFSRAGKEVALGRQEDEAFRPAAATVHYEDAVWVLRSIKFYQGLTGRELIDPNAFDRVYRTARRLQALNGIERTRSIDDKDGLIAAYLDLEDDAAALGEFEDLVRAKGLLGKGPGSAPPSFAELPAWAFRLALDFRRQRYAEVVEAGHVLASSSLPVPSSYRAYYVRILGLVGKSGLELGDVGDAEKHFRMALELDSENLDILLGLERCGERSGEGTAAAEVRQAIDRLTSPATIDLGGRVVEKGESFKVELVSDGRPRTLRLDFAPEVPGTGPLVSIVMNGRVVWEKNGDTGQAEFQISPRPGGNTLEITAVGGAIRLAGISQGTPAGAQGSYSLTAARRDAYHICCQGENP